MNEQIRKNLIFTKKIDGFVKEMIKEKGYANYTAVIHQAVIFMHSKMMPSYTRKMTATQLDQENQEGKLGFVALLKGKIVIQNGKSLCEYFTYKGKDRFLQLIDINLLNQDVVDNQYYPNRERIEKLQKESKVNY